jgi:Fic family protein
VPQQSPDSSNAVPATKYTGNTKKMEREAWHLRAIKTSKLFKAHSLEQLHKISVSSNPSNNGEKARQKKKIRPPCK